MNPNFGTQWKKNRIIGEPSAASKLIEQNQKNKLKGPFPINYYKRNFVFGHLLPKTKTVVECDGSKAKNVILFIGDGMGVPSMTAGRILIGGESHQTYIDSLDYTGLLKTYNVDYQTPGSDNLQK